jgi:hypothetical protein
MGNKNKKTGRISRFWRRLLRKPPEQPVEQLIPKQPIFRDNAIVDLIESGKASQGQIHEAVGQRLLQKAAKLQGKMQS